MVWTAPQTWTTSQVVTAADMNGDVRDNMLETAAATAAAAGDIVYADAANSMGSRLAHPGESRMLVSGSSNTWVARQPVEAVNFQSGATSDSSTSTSYTPNFNAGSADPLPSVTVTTGTAAVVEVSCMHVSNDTAGNVVLISFSISGATTSAAVDARAARFESSNADDRGSISAVRLAGLTAGSNTFQMEALVGSGSTGTIDRPRILVIPW